MKEFRFLHPDPVAAMAAARPNVQSWSVELDSDGSPFQGLGVASLLASAFWGVLALLLR